VTELTCFKAYDIRGEIGINIDEAIAHSIGRAVAEHFSAKSVVIGFDTRETSPAFAAAAARGVMDADADVLNIGLVGTEEMYWAVTEFGACAGIEVTASHNPINYNGMKIVKVRVAAARRCWGFSGDKGLGWLSKGGLMLRK
jgi:phosphomannomutase